MQVQFVAVVLALIAAAPPTAAAPLGKVYVVGMGPSPDLVTLRGVAAAKEADLFILESAADAQVWAAYVGTKPVLYAPRVARIYYGTDPATLKTPAEKARAARNDATRRELAAAVEKAVRAGKTAAFLQWGDPMVFGSLYLLEMLPPEIPTEIIPGVGAFAAGSAALKRSTVYGWDTNSVILTMTDWPGRADTNAKLMATQTSMVFYTMGLNYPELFAQLKKAYPAETPVAVVSYTGDRAQQAIRRSTVGAFLRDVDWKALPVDMHTLFVGKFLTAGQARKDGVIHGLDHIEGTHAEDVPPAAKTPPSGR